MLVHDAHALLATLKRLHVLNDGVLFYNEQGTLKIMLRNDPVDSDTLACEVVIVVDEEDESMRRILELCNDGYLEDPSTFVLQSWSFPSADFTVEEASKVMRFLNDVYLFRVCGCGKYIIKDDASMCLFCHMTSTAADRELHFCAICCDEGVAMHMTELGCCKQRLHKHCLNTWKSKSGNDRCPLCRH